MTFAALTGWALAAAPCRADVNALNSRQKDDGAGKEPEKKPDDIFATYLFDTRKYNDLSVRAYVLQREQEIAPSGPASARDKAYNRLALEYVRRISSGYTSDTVRSAQDDQNHGRLRPRGRRLVSDDDAIISEIMMVGKLGYNMMVAYQPLVISNALEGRLHYDAGANSMDCGMAFGSQANPHTVAEFRYFITERPFIPAIPREYIANAMEAVDQFGLMDRATVTVTHRLRKIGFSARTRYAMNAAVLSYGVSQRIAGPLVAHVVRENNFSGAASRSRNGVVAMMSFTAVF